MAVEDSLLNINATAASGQQQQQHKTKYNMTNWLNNLHAHSTSASLLSKIIFT